MENTKLQEDQLNLFQGGLLFKVTSVTTTPAGNMLIGLIDSDSKESTVSVSRRGAMTRVG